MALATRTFVRAREGNRTPDLRITSALLCRLSYSGDDKTARSRLATGSKAAGWPKTAGCPMAPGCSSRANHHRRSRRDRL